ncbi:hypothetical protein BKA93DRAFT_749606 [Sparassis latifolia]
MLEAHDEIQDRGYDFSSDPSGTTGREQEANQRRLNCKDIPELLLDAVTERLASSLLPRRETESPLRELIACSDADFANYFKDRLSRHSDDEVLEETFKARWRLSAQYIWRDTACRLRIPYVWIARDHLDPSLVIEPGVHCVAKRKACTIGSSTLRMRLLMIESSTISGRSTDLGLLPVFAGNCTYFDSLSTSAASRDAQKQCSDAGGQQLEAWAQEPLLFVIDLGVVGLNVLPTCLALSARKALCMRQRPGFSGLTVGPDLGHGIGGELFWAVVQMAPQRQRLAAAYLTLMQLLRPRPFEW